MADIKKLYDQRMQLTDEDFERLRYNERALLELQYRPMLSPLPHRPRETGQKKVTASEILVMEHRVKTAERNLELVSDHLERIDHERLALWNAAIALDGYQGLDIPRSLAEAIDRLLDLAYKIKRQ